jgi:hypothetical protein
MVFPTDTLMWLASGLSEHCVKNQCGLAACLSEDARLSTFSSPMSVQELQRWDNTVSTNWIPQNWGERKKGKKK